jgi:hypothetical protein
MRPFPLQITQYQFPARNAGKLFAMVALDFNGLSTANYLQETFHDKDKQHIFCLKLLKTSFLPFKRKALTSKTNSRQQNTTVMQYQ